MDTLFKIAVYVVSVFVSNKYAAGYWVVGPVFAMAVVSWQVKGPQDLLNARHLVFVGLSTLIYSVVYGISRLEWDLGNPFFTYFLGSFSAAVVTGSILMSAAHTWSYRKSKACMMRALLWLVGSYYAIVCLLYAEEVLKLAWDVNWITVMIAIWQGAYLLAFDRRRS